MSLLRHDISNYWQLNCLFNSLFRPTTRNTINDSLYVEFSHKWAVIVSFDLKSSATWLFVQQNIQANNNKKKASA